MLTKDFRRWSGTGRPGVLQSMGWQRVRHDCATEQQPKTKHNVFRDYFTCYFSSMYMDNETTFQFSSVAHSCPTPWTVARQSSLSITNSRSLLKLMSVELVMSPNRLILCHPLLLLPAFTLSPNQGLFQWVSSSHQVAKVLEFQLQHQSFQWIFRTAFL